MASPTSQLPPHPTVQFPDPINRDVESDMTVSTRDLWVSGIPLDYPYALDDRKGRLRWALPFFEWKATGAPPDDIGSPTCPMKVASVGDTYLDHTPGQFALWVRLDPEEDEGEDSSAIWTAGRKWRKWPGVQPDDPRDAVNVAAGGDVPQMPFNKDKLVVNPYIYDRFLWCDGKAAAWLATNTIEISRRVMRKAGVFALEDTCLATQTTQPKVEETPAVPMDIDGQTQVAVPAAPAPVAQTAPTPIPTYREFEAKCHHRVLAIMYQYEAGETTSIALSIPKRRKSEKRDRTNEVRRDRKRERPVQSQPGAEATRKSSRRAEQEAAASAMGDSDELTEDEEEEEEEEPEPARKRSHHRQPSVDHSVKRQRVAAPSPSVNGRAPVASGSRPPGRPMGSVNKNHTMPPPRTNGQSASTRRGQSPVDVRDVRRAQAAADTGELILGFHTTVTSRDATISGRDETISQRDATIKTHTGTINTLTSTIAQQNTSLVALEASVAELNGRIGRRNAELDEHIHTIQELTASEKALKAEAKKNELLIKQTQATMATLAATNKEQAANIEELSNRVTRRNLEVEGYVATIKRRDERIAQLQAGM